PRRSAPRNPRRPRGKVSESTCAALTRELEEARQQQAVTGEILRVISSSPSDVQPIFDIIVRSAVKLCDGIIGAVLTFDGELIHSVALQTYSAEALATAQRLYPMRPSRQQLSGRAVLTRTIVHVPDVLSDSEYAPDIALAGGWRGGLAVPMIRNETVIGVILVMRAQAGLFSQEQIELLKIFAAQAAIAIENVKLCDDMQARTRELSDALAQQTATSEILQVISSSPRELEPVFQAMLAHATRLCEANFGVLYRFDGQVFHAVALQDAVPALGDYLRRQPPRPDPRNALGRVLRTKQPVHIADITLEPAYAEREPARVAAVELAKARTFLAVPVLKENELLGIIAIYRQEVRPFTDKQIALVQ